MATIKSFTDLEQSKKLAEILPLESADMNYRYDFDFDELESIPTITEEDDHFKLFPKDIRCWSLAALLGIVCEVKRMDYSDKWEAASWNKSTTEQEYYVDVEGYDNPVDACVALIEKLHELKLL